MIEGFGFAKGSPVPVIGGSFIAGFFASACSLPFDFVKTRLQKQTPNADGSLQYKGPIDCAMQVQCVCVCIVRCVRLCVYVDLTVRVFALNTGATTPTRTHHPPTQKTKNDTKRADAQDGGPDEVLHRLLHLRHPHRAARRHHLGDLGRAAQAAGQVWPLGSF